MCVFSRSSVCLISRAAYLHRTSLIDNRPITHTRAHNHTITNDASKGECGLVSHRTSHVSHTSNLNTWWSEQGASKWPASQCIRADNYFQLQLEELRDFSLWVEGDQQISLPSFLFFFWHAYINTLHLVEGVPLGELSKHSKNQDVCDIQWVSPSTRQHSGLRAGVGFLPSLPSLTSLRCLIDCDGLFF